MIYLACEPEALERWSAEDFDGWLTRSSALRELCAYAVSEEYFQARKALGLVAVVPETED